VPACWSYDGLVGWQSGLVCHRPSHIHDRRQYDPINRLDRQRPITVRTKNIILCVVCALAAWLAAVAVAVSIPGSPFHAMQRLIERLGDRRVGPAAFNEFLVLGHRMKVIGAIVFPLVAGLAVALLSHLRFRLNWREGLTVVIVFSGFIFVWRGGIGYFGLADLASIVIFAASVALGIVRPRSARAV
jgi:hypothetical protein